MTYNLIKLNNGRNCLRYIIRAFNIKEIYIPYYICPVLRNAVYREACKINFYHIDEKFFPLYDLPKYAYILYPNYLGVCSSIVKELVNKYPNLIVDNAHSFFSEPCGLASFNSIRKFFPNIRNGAFLYVQKNLDFNFSKDEFEYDDKPLSEVEIIKNEYFLVSQNIKIMSDCTFSYFSSLDLNSEKKELRKSFEDYYFQFSSINKLNIKIKNDDIPYKYPLLIEEKLLSDVLLYLRQRGVVPFRMWHKLPDKFPESIFYKSLLVL